MPAPQGNAEPVLVSLLAASEYFEVAGLVTSRLPEPERELAYHQFLSHLLNGKLDVSGVYVARQTSSARIVGVQVLQVSPGGVGSLILPFLRDQITNAAVTFALLQRAKQHFVERRVYFAQMILPSGDVGQAEPLLRIGFRYITRLLHMVRVGSDELPELIKPLPELVFTPYQETDSLAFAQAISQTYLDTLDVPETGLNRTPEEILQDLLENDSNSSNWWIVSSKSNEVVAVLLINVMSGATLWDITYLGVLPMKKRQGIGTAMMHFVIQKATEQGILGFHLSVDERNTPAQQLYQNFDFNLYRTQEVFLWRPDWEA